MGQSEEPDYFYLYHLHQTTILIDRYFTPLLCLLGSIGNSLSLMVFGFDAHYRSQSASYYLSALALSDTGFLLSLFAVWLESVRELVITSDFICPLVMYLGQVTCFLSVYLIVAFSAERYVAVHYPLARARICTKSKARKIIGGITAAALLLFSYAWVIAGVVTLEDDSAVNSTNAHRIASNITTNTSFVDMGTGYRCSVPDKYFHISEIANYLDTCITLVIPFLLITYFNASIARSLWKLKDIRRELVATTRSQLTPSPTSTRSSFEENEEPAAVAAFSNSSTETSHHKSRVFTLFDALLRRMERASPMYSRGNEEDSNGRSVIELKEVITTISPSYGGIEASKGIKMVSEKQHHSNPRSVNEIDDEEAQKILSVSPEPQQQSLEENKEITIGSDVLIVGPISGKSDRIQQQQAQNSQQHNLAVKQSSVLSALPPSSSSEMRVTKTLLLVSSAFLLLNLPLHAVRCAQFIQTLTTSYSPSATMSIEEVGTDAAQSQQQHDSNLELDSVDLFILPTAQLWANMLFNSNFAVNFLLYCVNGRNFRKALRKIITRILRRNQTLHTTSSTYFYYNNPRNNAGGGGGGPAPLRASNISQQEME